MVGRVKFFQAPNMRNRVLLVVILSILAVSLSFTSTAAQKRAVKGRARKNPGAPLFVAKSTPAELQMARQQMELEVLKASAYQGLDVQPQAEATGTSLRLQNEAAVALERLDFVPQGRLDFFKTVTDLYPEAVKGWTASVVDATVTPDGLLMKLRVHINGGGHTYYAGHVFEYYLYANGKVKFLRSEPGKDVAGGLVKFG